MSEAEKQRRLDYKKNRRKWLTIWAAVLAALVFFTVISSILFYQLNKTYYVNYTERGDVDYTVTLKDNDFYDSTQMESDKAYVAELIDRIVANFSYNLKMETDRVDFEYTYRIDALLEIADKNTGKILLDKMDELVAEKTVSKRGSGFSIVETVVVDFEAYNRTAKDFIRKFGLKEIETSCLILRMQANVVGASEEFDDNRENAYVTELRIPLNVTSVNMTKSTSVEEGGNQILACANTLLRDVFQVLSIAFVCLSLLGVVGIFAFAYLTRNTDINYEIQVKRLVNSYKSYIQKINNPFDDTGYQLLMVDTFTEMLEIRDTIQSPVLMNENDDKTCTRFFIPTNTKLLYVFEIKVEGYDELYATSAAEAHDEALDDIIVLEEVEEKVLVEAMHTADVNLSEIDYVDDADMEEVPEGVEVIEVVWPEKAKANKLYRYDPNGEQVSEGDVVLVPSRDAAQNKDIIRKAAVAHGNHHVDPSLIKHPLKRIIAIVKRKAEDILTSKEEGVQTESSENEAETQ